MNICIAGIEFDRSSYDRTGDVLYLSAGPADRAVDFDELPEGHALRFDERGNLITIVGPRRLLEHEGTIRITLPEIETVGGDARARAGVADR